MNDIVRNALFAALAATMLALSPASGAAGNCRGLEASRCAKDAGCTWVDSYTTKKGSKVNGYCRGKGGQKADTTAGSAKTAPKGQTSAARKSGGQ